MWSDEARAAAAAARASNGSHQEGVNKAVPSAAAQELKLYADNHSDLYRQSFQPIVSNLGKKMDKGTYDPDKAEKLWGYHADRAAQAYAKEFGGGQKWHQMFTPSDRRQAAHAFETDNRERIRSGEFK